MALEYYVRIILFVEGLDSGLERSTVRAIDNYCIHAYNFDLSDLPAMGASSRPRA
jgi:hypothetical protein